MKENKEAREKREIKLLNHEDRMEEVNNFIK